MKLILLLVLFTFTVSVSASSENVYPGCSAPEDTYARTVIADANEGNTLQEMLRLGKVIPGDRVILIGDHGELNWSSPMASGERPWIWIEGQNASLHSVNLTNVRNVLFKGIRISAPGPRFLFRARGGSNILLEDSELAGPGDSSTWGLREWLRAPHGVHTEGTTCISVIRNKLSNIRHGIELKTAGLVSEETSVRGLIKQNDMQNFSGDYLRPIGSDIDVIENRGLDGFVSMDEGDPNHDDFIQGYAYPLGIEYRNVKIIGNYFQETTNPRRKWNAPYQGISVFDGLYTDFLIRGNKVLAGAHHGIAMYWGRDGIIEDNILMSVYPDGKRNLWITVHLSKGKDPSKNILVQNNICNYLQPNPENPDVRYENNLVFPQREAPDFFQEFDLENARFNLDRKP